LNVVFKRSGENSILENLDLKLGEDSSMQNALFKNQG